MTQHPHHRWLALVTGLLLPAVLLVGLVSSAARGGPGFRLGATAFQITKTGEANFSPRPDQPVFVLLVGNDARPGDASSRGDALHLVGLNPAAGQATILNIPRDTWVPIPGHGTDKINAAYQIGGPRLQAETVGQLVGVTIPYVVTTGFDGFQAMVDELGGVDVDVPFPMDDDDSGAHFAAGPTHMDGGAALAFSRDRHLEDGDFTRTTDQSILIVGALAKLRAAGPTAANAIRWLSVLFRDASFDGAGLADVYRLGRLALSVDPGQVRSVTMPATTGTVGAASVVFVGDGAASLFTDFSDDAVLQSH